MVMIWCMRWEGERRWKNLQPPTPYRNDMAFDGAVNDTQWGNGYSSDWYSYPCPQSPTSSSNRIELSPHPQALFNVIKYNYKLIRWLFIVASRKRQTKTHRTKTQHEVNIQTVLHGRIWSWSNVSRKGCLTGWQCGVLPQGGATASGPGNHLFHQLPWAWPVDPNLSSFCHSSFYSISS